MVGGKWEILIFILECLGFKELGGRKFLVISFFGYWLESSTLVS